MPRPCAEVLVALAPLVALAACSSGVSHPATTSDVDAAYFGTVDAKASHGGDGGHGSSSGHDAATRSDGSHGGTHDGKAPGDGGSPATLGTHFASTATRWPLPTDPSFPQSFNLVDGDYYVTMDLNGDGKPDLVVTEAASAKNPQWNVYLNTGSGFATSATDWALPTNTAFPDSFNLVNGNYYATTDLNGDGKPDLVVTEAASKQNQQWSVYVNTGTSFAAGPDDWPLPTDPSFPDSFNLVDGAYYTTMDMNGDGKPDLVVTEAASALNPQWNVYLNTGGGFAQSATAWALPTDPAFPDSFNLTDGNYYMTMNLNGDKRPDLIVTQAASAKNPAWNVYLNTGTGFAKTATAWPLPTDPSFPNSFNLVDGDYYATMDLNGDGKPDLVVTEAASKQNPLWNVYLNTGSGFASSAAAWALPTDPSFPQSFNLVDGNYYLTMDLNGDGRPDLVVSEAASATNADWNVYLNEP